MLKILNRMIEKEVKKRIKEKLEPILKTFRDKCESEVEYLDSRVNDYYKGLDRINSEHFIDEVVERIKKKQL